MGRPFGLADPALPIACRQTSHFRCSICCLASGERALSKVISKSLILRVPTPHDFHPIRCDGVSWQQPDTSSWLLGPRWRRAVPVWRFSKISEHYGIRMPRNQRCVLPGEAYHLTQRGTNRQRVFFKDADRSAYQMCIRDSLRLKPLSHRGRRGRPHTFSMSPAITAQTLLARGTPRPTHLQPRPRNLLPRATPRRPPRTPQVLSLIHI